MKRILFCSPVQHSKELGGSKVVVELAEEMREIGWDCQIICPSDVSNPRDKDILASFPENLRRYLQQHASEYDVVDYDHGYLPFERSEFNSETLMVARSVLLAQHLEVIPIPDPPGIKAAVGRLLRGRERRQRRKAIIQRAQITVQEADLVNVSNEDDKAELVRRGIKEDKIVVLPYGISRSRRPLFDQVSSEAPPQPVVAFVGTFDYRKGAREFPEIVRQVAAAVPEVRFKLMGTKGMFQTEAEVRAHFPERMQKHLEVIPGYKSEELPQMLSSCSVGIFPSHLEGFGFGILEMLAASVPVIAYDAPGPPMMLPAECLVERGDTDNLGRKVAALLLDPVQLQISRTWANERSQDFSWAAVAQATHTCYMTAINLKQRTLATKL